MNFEDKLLRGIPREEAAAFFIRVRGTEKEASVEELEAALNELPAHEREELLKSAAMPGMSSGGTGGSVTALPPTGRGQNMQAATPPALPPTAMGQQAMPGTKMAMADAEKKSPEEVGKERAHAALSAEFEKEKGHKHERRGEIVGRIGGALAGGAAMHRYGHGNPLATLGGVALGQHMGGNLGREAGAHSDRHAHEKSASAFKLALEQMSKEAVSEDWVKRTARSAARSVSDGRLKAHADKMSGMFERAVAPELKRLQDHAAPIQSAIARKAHHSGMAAELEMAERAARKLPLRKFSEAMQPQGIEPQLDPATQQLLAMQQAGDQAAEQNQAEFLRQKLEEARAQAEAAQAEAATLQEQQALHDQQTAQSQQQIQQSMQQAMQAQDQVLQQQQAAAAMRIAYQQLRGTLLQAASTEPPAMAMATGGTDAASAAASQAAGPSSAPAPTAGPAGQAPNPGVPPTGMAPAGDDTVSTPAGGTEPMFGNAQPTTSVGQQEQTGDAKTPGKEVLSHYRPFVGSKKTASLRDMLFSQAGKLKAVLPHAAVGAAVGAGLGAGESFTSNEPLQKRVQELEAKPDRGYGDTLNLAQSKARLTVGEFAQKHPAAMMGMGALGGALTGAAEGPGLVSAVQGMGSDARAIGKNVMDAYKRTRGAA